MYGPRAPFCDLPGLRGRLAAAGETTLRPLGLGSVPHVAVQTAASVSGYADDCSVLLVDGVKRTTATRWPERLLIDSEAIARAPVELNRAGLGDPDALENLTASLTLGIWDAPDVDALLIGAARLGAGL
jgi:hypothetical protein